MPDALSPRVPAGTCQITLGAPLVASTRFGHDQPNARLGGNGRPCCVPPPACPRHCMATNLHLLRTGLSHLIHIYAITIGCIQHRALSNATRSERAAKQTASCCVKSEPPACTCMATTMATTIASGLVVWQGVGSLLGRACVARRALPFCICASAMPVCVCVCACVRSCVQACV